MKILHSADLHLDSPFGGHSPEQTDFLRQQLLEVPDKIVARCKEENCDLILLAGDLFDGPWSKESFQALRFALEEAGVPVFISPGNHDFVSYDSPYLSENWPGNVHIFTNPCIESVAIPELDCRIYGAGFRSMDCDALMKDFHITGKETYHIAVLHGDPTQTDSPYCPISKQQIADSGLDYLALGHIHKGGSFRVGKTLCAWPGVPMSRGFDELGIHGVLITTLDTKANTVFSALDTVRFLDYECHPEEVADILPAGRNEYFYRVTLTGESPAVDLSAMAKELSHYRNLEIRDRTVPLKDIWGSADEDTLEGIYFGLLKDALAGADQETSRAITLAARLSRQILDGEEVRLP
jgi:DNA repair exonuclease SbcCD nuclease subunit